MSQPILRAELDGEVEVVVNLTDLTAFIHASPDAYVVVSDEEGNQSQVTKKSLTNFRLLYGE